MFSSRSVTTHTVCGKGACTVLKLNHLYKVGVTQQEGRHYLHCILLTFLLYKCMPCKPQSLWSWPAWQLSVKVCHCLQQMYFLMKVWGQYVLSQGKGSINNYLPHSWQFFLHPYSTPTAPLLYTHISRSLIIDGKPKPAFFFLGIRGVW